MFSFSMSMYLHGNVKVLISSIKILDAFIMGKNNIKEAFSTTTWDSNSDVANVKCSCTK